MIFSLILPVYKVEKYIERCIESCCTQTDFLLKDYEIIIVDDSSPDNSIRLAESVFKKYPEINYRVVHRPNGGLSAARNTGIQHANGDFIWFIDSDDYIEENALSVLYKVISQNNDIQVVTFGHRNIYPTRVIDCPPPSKLFNHTSSGIDLISNTAFYSACNRIYRKDLLLSTGLRFVEGILWEDGELNLRLLSVTSSHYCIPDILYNYLRRADSISTGKRIAETLKSDLYKFDSLSSWIREHKEFSELTIRILNKRNNEAILFFLAGINGLAKLERSPYYKELWRRKASIKDSFNNSINPLHRLVGLGIIYFPKLLATVLGYRLGKILSKERELYQ